MNALDRHDAAVLAALTRLMADLVDAGALEAEERRRPALALAAEEAASLSRERDGPARRMGALR